MSPPLFILPPLAECGWSMRTKAKPKMAEPWREGDTPSALTARSGLLGNTALLCVGENPTTPHLVWSLYRDEPGWRSVGQKVKGTETDLASVTYCRPLHEASSQPLLWSL